MSSSSESNSPPPQHLAKKYKSSVNQAKNSGTSKKVDKPLAYNPKWEKEDWAKGKNCLYSKYNITEVIYDILLYFLITGWLTKSRRGIETKQAACIVCNIDLRAHSQDLKNHASTAKHKENMGKLELPKITSTSNTLSKQIEDKKKDIRLAICIRLDANYQID